MHRFAFILKIQKDVKMNRKIMIARTLMMIFLAACKATPDEAVVAQKTDYSSYTFA